MKNFDSYKKHAIALFSNAGWSARGIFKAFKVFKIMEAYASGESPEAFFIRVDTEAPLGMAS